MQRLNDDLWRGELGFSVALDLASRFVLIKKESGARVYRSWFFNDEPKLFSYNVDLNGLIKKPRDSDDGVGSGTALTPKVALMKAMGESIERYCLCLYGEKKFTNASYKAVKHEAIDIFKLRNFSAEQLKRKEFKNYRYDEQSKMNWVEGFSLRDGKNILIPAQLVYVPYKFGNEVCIRDPITTGAAASTSLGGAVYRGMCEIIERDAFMITYLNKLSRESIDLNCHKELKKMKKMCERYNLELKVIDISTDLGVAAMMGVIVDRTGIGPAVSFGLSADLDPMIAAIGAAKESFHGRPWIRSEMMKQVQGKSLNDLVNRGIYWSDPKMIKKCQFLFENDKNKVLIQKYKSRYKPNKLKKMLLIFTELFNYDVYFVEVTTPEIRKYGFRVVKVIIPDLHPLYLDDVHPYWESKRLFEVPKKMGLGGSSILNKIPHPFL
ncbi:MAG: YcaO-like family protein [Candidatus Shapirobacteria bacterium]|nr:YcaO-like family protein [Candidatus Shapirobacteria bacterium]